MKKKNIIIISIIAVILLLIPTYIVVSRNFSKDVENETTNAHVKIYYTLENRHIYLHDLTSVTITYKDETKELKKWLDEDKDIWKNYLESLRKDKNIKYVSYDDGGTEVFEKSDFNIIVCNKISGNTNIHIGEYLTINDSGVCSMPIVENLERKEEIFLFHLGYYLEQLLGEPGEETKLKEISLSKLIDIDLKDIEYSKVMQHKKVGTYVIVKTNNKEAITKIEDYFKDKYKEYQTVSLDNEYKVYIANKDNNFKLGLKYISGTIDSASLENHILSITGDDKNKYTVDHNTFLNFEKGQKVKILYNSLELPNSQYNIETKETYPLQVKIYGINIDKK